MKRYCNKHLILLLYDSYDDCLGSHIIHDTDIFKNPKYSVLPRNSTFVILESKPSAHHILSQHVAGWTPINDFWLRKWAD